MPRIGLPFGITGVRPRWLVEAKKLLSYCEVGVVSYLVKSLFVINRKKEKLKLPIFAGKMINTNQCSFYIPE